MGSVLHEVVRRVLKGFVKKSRQAGMEYDMLVMAGHLYDPHRESHHLGLENGIIEETVVVQRVVGALTHRSGRRGCQRPP